MSKAKNGAAKAMMERTLAMTWFNTTKAQDGERKVLSASFAGRMRALAWRFALGMMLVFSPAAMSRASERIVSHPTHQLALFGYDAVAYFADGGPRLGLAAFEVLHNGLVWRFANEGNLTSFLQDPEAFLPAYGGHGALMMARGQATAGHPEVTILLGGRVFFFRDVASRYAFLLEAEHAMARADANWPQIRRTLAP